VMNASDATGVVAAETLAGVPRARAAVGDAAGLRAAARGSTRGGVTARRVPGSHAVRAE
jgi:hypothetical protein